MNKQNCTADQNAGGAKELVTAAGYAQQAIEAVKQALLLTDQMAIFGSGLTHRMNLGTAEDWNRKAPSLTRCPEFIADARRQLELLRAELDRVRANTTWDEGGEV